MLDFDAAELVIRVPVVLLSLTVHEFCHAYFALRMGDPTAYRLGRCSLNPLRHLDPLGTLCLMFAPIGWAKPVPINAENFANPPRARGGTPDADGWYDSISEVTPQQRYARMKRGMLIATAAGPLSNLVLALLFGLLIRGLTHLPITVQQGQGSFWSSAMLMCYMALMINTGLAVFNCLPLFPLDGFHIALGLQRPGREASFAETARFGPFVIMGLVLLGGKLDLLGMLIRPVMRFMLHTVAGLPAFGD